MARRGIIVICVEYLAIFHRADSFCDSSDAFARLLQVDSNIVIRGSEIRHCGDPAYGLAIAAGEVKGKKQRYFHLRLTWDATIAEKSSAEVDKFMSLLKTLRATVSQAGGDTEILRDDVSAHYAISAYPLIYDIETLMRRLIAKFMLITVGREWVDETLPQPVLEAVRNSKRGNSSTRTEATKGPKDYLNVLHTVDFIHLGQFLFTPYSNKSVADLHARLKDVLESKTLESALDGLHHYVPQSNWSRYFKGVVDCDDSYISSRWEKLYEFRCKVAHNTMVTRRDFEDIAQLVGEVKPKLHDAIAKLSSVIVPPEEIELVAEHAAGSVNAALGEFISCWQEIETAFSSSFAKSGGPAARRIYRGEELVQAGVLPAGQVRTYDELRLFRNRIVHGPIADVPTEELQRRLRSLRALRDRIATIPYIAYLRTLSKDDLDSEIDARIADTEEEILESEQFTNTMADTNASGYSIDEYDIRSIEIRDSECVVTLSYTASGDQHEDRMYLGETICGEAVAIIDNQQYVTYQDVSAEVSNPD